MERIGIKDPERKELRKRKSHCSAGLQSRPRCRRRKLNWSFERWGGGCSRIAILSKRVPTWNPWPVIDVRSCWYWWHMMLTSSSMIVNIDCDRLSYLLLFGSPIQDPQTLGHFLPYNSRPRMLSFCSIASVSSWLDFYSHWMCTLFLLKFYEIL